MKINDSKKTTIKQKIKKLKELFGRYGFTIKVVSKDKELLKRVS